VTDSRSRKRMTDEGAGGLASEAACSRTAVRRAANSAPTAPRSSRSRSRGDAPLEVLVRLIHVAMASIGRQRN
jgi:hypothetical protein